MYAQPVSIPYGSHILGGYLTLPDGDGRFPAVVVIHEAYGLNDNIEAISRRFAEEGYAALAVDLFSSRNRAVCMFRFFLGLRFRSLDNLGIHDLAGALSYLAGMPKVDESRLGAIGFCMGGGFAIAWACADNRLKVVAPFYATNPRPLDAVARACPVVGSYPGKDFTARSGRALDAELDRCAIPHDIKIYPNAKHSFFNDHSSRYNAPAAEDSWQRVTNFFAEHL